MARHMGDNGEAFRAAITTTTTHKPTPEHPEGRVTVRTSYEGPYASVGAAKSRITWAGRRNSYRNSWDDSVTEITGRVERAVTNWEAVE